MKFVKWRSAWAWGLTTWNWMTFSDESDSKIIREMMERKAESIGGHSDKYRYIECTLGLCTT